MDDYDGQMIFGDLVGLKLPDIRLTGEEQPRKTLHPGKRYVPNKGSYAKTYLLSPLYKPYKFVIGISEHLLSEVA